MKKKDGDEGRLSFKSVFAQSIKDAGEGRLAMVMTVARHPQHMIMEMLGREGRAMKGSEHIKAWMGADLPWMGAAVWAMPAGMEREMIHKACCGSLFSHGNAKAEADRAYIEHLGPLGSQVSGTQWNSSAFQNSEDYPINVTVGLYDLSTGRGDSSRMDGSARPSHWPEPLPMIKRVWRDEDPPSLAPDFGAVAELLAWQIRASVAEAILEETDATPGQLEDLLGGVLCLPNKAAKHFARQEHAMFGASKLGPEERAESMLAMDVARVAFELGGIQRAAKEAALGKRDAQRL